MKYIGLDVHKRNTYACITNASGKEIHSMEVRSRPDGLEAIAEYMGEDEYAVMMESSTYSVHVHRFFEERNVETYTAHAKYLSMITRSDRKTDKIDASHIARYLRLWKNGELPLSMSHIPDRKAQSLRDLCRLREDITKETGNHARKIHSHIAMNGIDAVWNLKTKKARKFLRGTYRDDTVLMNRLDLYESLLDKAAQLDRELEIAGKNDENVRLLTTIPGIGIRSAVQIMSMIIGIDRFQDAEKLCSYFGLVPRVRDSGGKEHHGGMTKSGDPMMRAVLDRVTYVHVCCCDSSLTAFFERKKKENPKKALTSASRKMLCMIYAVLSRGTGFTA